MAGAGRDADGDDASDRSNSFGPDPYLRPVGYCSVSDVNFGGARLTVSAERRPIPRVGGDLTERLLPGSPGLCQHAAQHGSAGSARPFRLTARCRKAFWRLRGGFDRKNPDDGAN
jgi:hypothetical protein